MRAVLLEDIEKLTVREVPAPQARPREVILRVEAVGVCGTDLHLYHGHGNYNFDSQGKPIPLTEQPQILGHEFCGEVVEVGREVNDLRAGDRVLCDQVRNCHGEGHVPLCAYCASGDSHQCVHSGEHGITGLPGALADAIAIPALNCIRTDLVPERAALVEPLGCILHASDRAEHAHGRYSFDGEERIRNVLICGGGPAGLLFLQYLRNVKRFDGLILVTDVRDRNLELARQMGGTVINVARQDIREAVLELTRGERVHYLIESCGNSLVFEQIPHVLRKQGTVLLYGYGHKGRDIGLIGYVLYLEPTLVAAIGASGGFEPDGRPTTYHRAQELVRSGSVQVHPFITHRYHALEEIHRAFERDFQQVDYIKGVLNMQSPGNR